MSISDWFYDFRADMTLTIVHISPLIMSPSKEYRKEVLQKMTFWHRNVFFQKWLKCSITNSFGKILIGSGSNIFPLSLKSISEWRCNVIEFGGVAWSEKCRILEEMWSKVERCSRIDLLKISVWRSSQFEIVAQPEDSSKNPSKLSSRESTFAVKSKWLIEAIIWSRHNSAPLKVFSA